MSTQKLCCGGSGRLILLESMKSHCDYNIRWLLLDRTKHKLLERSTSSNSVFGEIGIKVEFPP